MYKSHSTEETWGRVPFLLALLVNVPNCQQLTVGHVCPSQFLGFPHRNTLSRFRQENNPCGSLSSSSSSYLVQTSWWSISHCYKTSMAGRQVQSYLQCGLKTWMVLFSHCLFLSPFFECLQVLTIHK